METSLVRASAMAACLTALSVSGTKAADSDTQWWNLFTTTGHVAPKVRYFGEFQTRFSLVDRQSIDRTLLRGALGYQVAPRWSLWAGWGSTPTYHPKFRDETRWFQQALYENKIAGNAVIDRFRFEQRDVQDTGGTSLRLRNMARIAHPLDKSGTWQSVVYDELFWNVNSVANGPKSGFDQNRIFLGVNRLIAPHTRLEFGTMRVDLHLPSGATRHLDVPLTQVNFTF